MPGEREGEVGGSEEDEEGKREERSEMVGEAATQWARTTENPDVSTEPLARPFARALAPLTHSLTLHYSLCLRALLRSLACLFAHFAHSLARKTVNY